MPTLNPTAEQSDILDAYATGETVVVEALAGTGKTSTLVMMSEADKSRQGTYIAFNRAIADDGARKFPRRIAARTAHSFARAAVAQSNASLLDRLGNNARVPNWKVAEILGLPSRFDFGKMGLRDRKLAGLVKETIKRFCSSTDDVPRRHMVPRVPGLEALEARRALQDMLMPFVNKAWEDLTSDNGQLQFTHDVYLKLASNLPNFQLPGEVIFFDEAQDADPVVKKIVEDQRDKFGKQLVIVGDGNQQIYEWRGAVDAIDEFDADFRLPLTQSFRFGPAVAEEANRILSLLPTNLRVVGWDKLSTQLAVLDDPDVVLCRTNAEAIATLLTAQAAGERAGLVGGTGAVEALAKAALDLSEGRETYHPELQAFSSWAQVREYVEEENEARDLKVLVDLVDKHTPAVLMDVVQRAVPEQAADLVVSTAHKAKGREWDRVRVANDFPLPVDEDGDLSPAELRLAYVTVTRAKEFLDSSSMGWLGSVARRNGEERTFLPASDVPAREKAKSPVSEIAQVMIDPESSHRVMMTGTKYDPELVEAQRGLKSDLRPSYRGEYCGFERVRVVNASYQVLQVAERFNLTISPSARERIDNFM